VKILVIGLGSIGQRHLQNLKIIYPNAKFYALRLKNKNIVIKNVKILNRINLSKYYKIKIISSYKKAQLLKPNLVFICNPSIFHLRDANFFSKLGSNIFIEKPLSGEQRQQKNLIKILKKKRRQAMIGFQLRFHPAIKFVKNLIKNNKYGNVIRGNFDDLSYLPKFHPYEDYSKSYAARKELGGGVLSTLIHEVDLIAYFFDLPKKTYSLKYNSKILRSNVDDNVFCLMQYKKNKSDFFISLNLSFTSPKPKRGFEILFKKYSLKCDLLKNKIEIYSNQNNKIIYKKKYKLNRNKLFLDEIKYMKDCIKKNKNNFLSVQNTISTNQLYNMINK